MTVPIRLFEKAVVAGAKNKFLGWIAGEGPLQGLINVNGTNYVGFEFIWTVVPTGEDPNNTPPTLNQSVCDLFVVTPERARAMGATAATGLVAAPSAILGELDRAAQGKR